VSAALPPSLYPLLVSESANPNATNTSSSYPPAQSYLDVNSHYTGGRNILTRRLPHFLRRGGDSNNDPSPTPPSSNEKPKEGVSATPGPDFSVKPEDLMNASVNITVLIAMPSPSTVFPSALSSKPKRKGSQAQLTNNTSMTSLRSPASIQTFASAVGQQNSVVEEESIDDKGKARGAPSVRTAASGKSLAEARREAYFAAANLEDPQAQESGAQPRMSEDDDKHDGFGVDEDEEELPELVFGTASVPLFRRMEQGMGIQNDGLNQGLAGPSRTASIPMSISLSLPTSGDLNHPTKQDLTGLLSLAQVARDAKSRKLDAIKEAEEKKQNEETAERENSMNRSEDVDRSGVTFHNDALDSISISQPQDQSQDRGLETSLGSTPVVQRMLALNHLDHVNDSSSDQPRSSLAPSGYTFSSENERERERAFAPTPNTGDPLMNETPRNSEQNLTPRRSFQNQRVLEPAV